jgi:hypothetical protein
MTVTSGNDRNSRAEVEEQIPVRVFNDGTAGAFGNQPPNTVLSRVRAVVGSDAAMPATEEGKLAVEAYRLLKNGEEPTPKQLAALQFLLRLTRPAPLVHNGFPDNLPTAEHVETFPTWSGFQKAATCLRRVGRIDRASPTLANASSSPSPARRANSVAASASLSAARWARIAAE